MVEEVSVIHMRDSGLDLVSPLTHPVRVSLGVCLDCGGSATIGVPLTQYGVYRRTEHGGIASSDFPLLIGGRLVREVRKLVALGLQLGNSSLKLRDRCRDIGQLDDVGIRGTGELTQLS